MASEQKDISTPIGNRLKTEMKKRNLTSSELARRSGVLTSFLYDVIRGKSSNPSTIKLAKVAEAMGINLNYLVTGIEDDNTKNKLVEDYVSIQDITIYYSGDNKAGTIATGDYKSPYLFCNDWLKETIKADAQILKMLTISGDSMAPTLLHNDVVLVDTRRKTPSTPSIFVIFDGREFTAKRLEYPSPSEKSRIRVIADNKIYSAYECSAEDITIVGRVIWFSRSI